MYNSWNLFFEVCMHDLCAILDSIDPNSCNLHSCDALPKSKCLQWNGLASHIILAFLSMWWL